MRRGPTLRPSTSGSGRKGETVLTGQCQVTVTELEWGPPPAMLVELVLRYAVNVSLSAELAVSPTAHVLPEAQLL